jgi:5,5'-dehydrodivanillate O-demethylase
LGLVFAYLGEGEAPPLRRYPQLEGAGVLELYTPEYWPCNYFNRIDNACDVAHIAFAHRRSRIAVNELREVPMLSAEETEYGVRTDVLRGTSEVSSLHFLMPNTNHFRTSLSLREGRSSSSGAYLDRFLFRVPVDDENCVSFPLDFAYLTGEAAREYQERRRQLKQATPTAHTELGEAVLKGKSSMEEIENQPNLKNLTSLEDYVVQVGQGAIADRANDRIGKMDVGVFLLRKLWQRELKALAEGKPLKQWVIPEQVASKSLK